MHFLCITNRKVAECTEPFGPWQGLCPGGCTESATGGTFPEGELLPVTWVRLRETPRIPISPFHNQRSPSEGCYATLAS